MKKLTKKQRKKMFDQQLKKTMSVLRGSYQKAVQFSKRQSKNKMWEELS